ncbi:hypothetical protein Ddye_021841 [Dipteronia dyeriana]|uniref:Uncharacterized protein n=1 Tax=Dipteronia dyeriana TaxID=168575 RepID=A0AAD9U2E2_9ROSI|nr:hypothetical protein Ddye_021841 [Dipteronia dyeriana]
MAASATEMVVRSVFDGCLSLPEVEVEQRSYHRNYEYALHNLKGSDSSYGYCSKRGFVRTDMDELLQIYLTKIWKCSFSLRYHLIDANMKELIATGFMSNRG